MACDPTQLVQDARCIECAIPPGMQLPVLISLACQILSAQAQILNGAGNPASPPSNPAAPAIYYKDSLADPAIWVWSVTSQQWVNSVA